LPNEVTSRTPGEFKTILDRRNQEWKDIDTVFASFGQVYEEMTPISMLRTVAAIGQGTKLFVPHLLKEIRPVGQPGQPTTARDADSSRWILTNRIRRC
jgi:cell division protein FtsI/penicillin-binding protein 2